MGAMWTLRCETPEHTRRLGGSLVAAGTPATVALIGDLGAGKTCFAQGVGAALELEEAVVSPTFALVAVYPEGPLLHADLYRLEHMEEALGIGLDEELDAWEGIALVEWADRFPALLPPDHLVLELTDELGGRLAQITARGPRSRAQLAAWRAHHEAAHGR